MEASFTYTPVPGRVIFGPGSIQFLPRELDRLHLTSPLLICTPGKVNLAQAIQSILANAANHITAAGIYSKATMHTPTHITDDAESYMSTLKVDSLVSVGGGSTVGLGKALSIRTGLPHITIPTTYSGSEMTSILGETVVDQKSDGKGAVKTTRSDPKIFPTTIIYDVDLTMSLPSNLTATSGVNAIAHAVEALYAANANPITSLMALEGIKALAQSLPVLVSLSASTLASTSASPPQDDSKSTISNTNSQLQKARAQALYGAWLCGTCLGSTTMGFHHKLCHTLGGSFNLPHSEVHTIILPHALAYNAPCISPEVLQKLATALLPADDDGTIDTKSTIENGKTDAVSRLNVLLRTLKVKTALKDIGMNGGEEDIDRAADLAVLKEYENPRKVERNKVREVIRRAWTGEEARADL